MLRGGEVVGTTTRTKQRAWQMMVGRSVLLRVDKKPAMPRDVVLDVQGLNVDGGLGLPAVTDVSFSVKPVRLLASRVSRATGSASWSRH